MARKKAPPKRAPEYEKPKKSPPGKAKDGSACFTRTNKSGAAYVTCKGTQGDSKATKASTRPAGKGGKAKRTGGAPGKKKTPTQSSKPKPKAKAKPSISKDDYLDVSSIIATRNKQRIAEKPKLTAAQIRAKEYRKDFRYDVGDKVSFVTGRQEKAKVIAGTIEALTDKGVVMRANKGEVEKSVNRGFNFSVSYTWRPTEGTQKKVVSWGRVRGVQEYSGKSVSLGRVGG